MMWLSSSNLSQTTLLPRVSQATLQTHAFLVALDINSWFQLLGSVPPWSMTTDDQSQGEMIWQLGSRLYGIQTGNKAEQKIHLEELSTSMLAG